MSKEKFMEIIVFFIGIKILGEGYLKGYLKGFVEEFIDMLFKFVTKYKNRNKYY